MTRINKISQFFLVIVLTMCAHLGLAQDIPLQYTVGFRCGSSIAEDYPPRNMDVLFHGFWTFAYSGFGFLPAPGW